MNHKFVNYMGLDESKEQNVRQACGQTETVEEKLPMTSECPWKPWQHSRSRIKGYVLRLRRAMLALAGLEWYCYAALGILTALMSFLMDLTVAKLLRAHQWLYSKLEGDVVLQFLCWTLYPVSLCALSSGFSHSVCPYSAGSGLPEVRTIISGVELPNYLSLSNLFAKVVGLICTLASSSTVFLGKVGPFVHLSTMVGDYLNSLFCSMSGEKERGTRGEMLVVAAAVGVASCFGTPISGVLFSIEVMGTHYAVRDYCPCFFAAACGALTFRLLAVFSREQETVQALFKTSFSTELPFHPAEIMAFVLLGLLCGASSCFYLFCHRWILRFVKRIKFLSRFIATEKALYSGSVVFLLAVITFPYSAGRFMASQLSMKQLLSTLLDNKQWISISQNSTVQHDNTDNSLWQAWSPSGTSVFLSLAFFLFMKLWLLVLACTLPLPAGYFMPVFIYGAAIGRLLGESLAYLFPNGNSSEGRLSLINPGGYALAGAAAFSGAVTHTLSPALLALELTGQATHAVPTLLATLAANALARSRNLPSFYDGISIIKKLPYLPSIIRECPKLASIQIGQCLSPAGVVLERDETLSGVQRILSSSTDTEFPVVATHECQRVLGIISRADLETVLLQDKNKVWSKHLGDICVIQPFRVQLSTDSTVKQVHCIMSVVGEQHLFVTQEGKLVGVITWKEMKRIIEDLAKEV
ncbi:chloride channel K [Chanos chanos]|uniref:Chloride channel K n=1 Tax=Chanos chanos TaxID=29144 RepID=A0A6J2V311_CHACN|nr:chloride channel protein ClC-Ka [Chanos chanos]